MCVNIQTEYNTTIKLMFNYSVQIYNVMLTSCILIINTVHKYDGLNSHLLYTSMTV